MPKKTNLQIAYVFGDYFSDVFVKYTKRQTKRPAELRINCDLYCGKPKSAVHLCSVSFVCPEDAFISDEIRAREQTLLIALDKAVYNMKKNGTNADALKAAEPILAKLMRKDSPFLRFVATHFETVAVLRDWAPSTIEAYRNTLTNQLAPMLPHKEISQLTARDFDEAIDALNAKWEKETGSPYGADRINQFVSACCGIMDYASQRMNIENVVYSSKYYDSTYVKRVTVSVETRIGKRLRPKSLTLEDQASSAQYLLQETSGQERTLGTDIQNVHGLRLNEVGGLRYESILPFSSSNYKDRNYILVNVKSDSTGHFHPDLKTINGYRALPLPKVLDARIDQEKRYAMEKFGIAPDQIPYTPLVTKDGVNPKKPKEIGRTGKKLLKRAIGQSRERELALPVPQIENAAGTLIPLEENESAYQYRRNFCHTMLNILGFSLQSVQGMMGHDIPSLRSKRWMLYHEAKLIEQMNRMDQLILFPIASEEARTNEWEQTDPRKDIHVIDECGEFLDECALTLSAQPYSPTDVITLHLFVKCNEPTDALTITALTDGTEITAYPYSFTQEPNTTINIRNHYLDMVFAMCKKNIGKLDIEEDETLDDEMDITADETELEKYEAIPSEFDDDNADFLFEDDDVDMDYDIETENG